MVLVKSAMALSLTTGTTSAEQISGVYEFVQKGIINLYALGSATGLTCTLQVQGQPVINGEAVPFFGTTGTMKRSDHLVANAQINGGRLSLKFNNPTGGTLTVDYILEYIPTGGR